MTAATKTKLTSSHPKNSRKRNNITQHSQLIPNRAERSASSIRSCGIVGLNKNHNKS
jgi:hypothetical protein